MGKIYIITGKSATGKDTLFKKLLEDKEINLKTVVMYTTRPIRQGEIEGVEYHFVNEEDLKELEKANKVIEHRSYNTVHGIWHYFTVNDGQIDLNNNDYLMLGTVESIIQIGKFYGFDHVEPIYLEVPDDERLLRSIRREQRQVKPNYAEICRRYLADEEDFSEENLEKLNLRRRYSNMDINQCATEVISHIKNFTVK
ncbi:MAG TPA: guanylate kinase [Clostridiales bacterium]|nr:guanylate kinase [Clostridiales bacterium]